MPMGSREKRHQDAEISVLGTALRVAQTRTYERYARHTLRGIAASET